MNNRFKARISFFTYIALLFTLDNYYSFMIFNLFLAFAALELSFLLPLFKPHKKRKLLVSFVFFIVFILLSPNVFYVVTDLIHLNFFSFNYMEGLHVNEWWNFFVLISGVFIALFFYILMIKEIQLLLINTKWNKLILFVFMLLGGLGIYIGRFLRFHSIHLFTEPLSLLKQVLDSLNGNSLLFVIWMSVLQFIVYWFFVDSKGNEA